jgi:diamine N-acetyltransferase
MINLREITKKNLISIIDLKVGKHQKDQVASNAVSIAQGNYSNSAWFKGIFNDEIAVGFVMLDLIIEENKCFLWRFMIDEKYQGKGYGKIALTQVIDYVKSLKVFSNIKTSYVPAENGAEGFYKNFGFIDSDEIIKEFGVEDSDEIGMKYSLLQ